MEIPKIANSKVVTITPRPKNKIDFGLHTVFSIPQDGDFFGDMTLHIELEYDEPPVFITDPSMRLINRCEFDFYGTPYYQYTHNVYSALQIKNNNTIGDKTATINHKCNFWFNDAEPLNATSVPFGSRFVAVELCNHDDLFDKNTKVNIKSITLSINNMYVEDEEEYMNFIRHEHRIPFKLYSTIDYDMLKSNNKVPITKIYFKTKDGWVTTDNVSEVPNLGELIVCEHITTATFIDGSFILNPHYRYLSIWN